MISNGWIVFFSLLFLLLIYSLFFFFPWLFGAPFEPTRNKKIRDILKLAKVKKGEKAVDLGSGDGRIVLALAKKGAKAHGFEVNPLLVLISRYRIKKAGLKNKAFIHWKSFWKTSLKKYDVLILFQFPTIMERLEKKLKKELRPKARVVSYYWKFPNWKYSKRIKNVFLYEPNKVSFKLCAPKIQKENKRFLRFRKGPQN